MLSYGVLSEMRIGKKPLWLIIYGKRVTLMIKPALPVEETNMYGRRPGIHFASQLYTIYILIGVKSECRTYIAFSASD